MKTLTKIWQESLKDFLNSTFWSRLNFILFNLVYEQNLLLGFNITVTLKGFRSKKKKNEPRGGFSFFGEDGIGLLGIERFEDHVVKVILDSLLNFADFCSGQDQPLGHQVGHLSDGWKTRQ